jgi:hypothetical protein
VPCRGAASLRSTDRRPHRRFDSSLAMSRGLHNKLTGRNRGQFGVDLFRSLGRRPEAPEASLGGSQHPRKRLGMRSPSYQQTGPGPISGPGRFVLLQDGRRTPNLSPPDWANQSLFAGCIGVGHRALKRAPTARATCADDGSRRNCSPIVPQPRPCSRPPNSKIPVLQALLRGERWGSNPRPPGPQAAPTSIRDPPEIVTRAAT